MKLYPVKLCPHFEYLHLKYREKCQQQHTRITKNTITVSQRHINCLITVENNKTYLLRTQIGSSNAKEYQLLIELQRVFEIILIDEILVIACRNGYVGWHNIDQLLRKEKFGRIRITKEYLNDWSFSHEADKQDKRSRFSHFQIIKIGSQIVAIYSQKQKMGVNRINMNNKHTSNVAISLQSLGVDASFTIADLVVSKGEGHCNDLNKEIIFCIVLKKDGPESVQQLVKAVFIRLLQDQTITVSSETILQFRQDMEQSQPDFDLIICQMSNGPVMIHCRRQLVLLKKESRKIAAILNIEQNIIDMIAFYNRLIDQNTLLAISQQQNQDYVLQQYHIDKLISMQELVPTNITLRRRSTAFISFISIKTTDNALILLHFADSTYYLQEYFFSLSSIINGKGRNTSQANGQSIIPFDEEFFRTNSTAINIDCCHLLPLTKIKEIIDKQRNLFIEALNQSLLPQLILQRVNRINCEAFGCKVYNLWVSLFEFIRQYLTIFLYLAKFIQYLRGDETSEPLISNSIKDMLRQVASREIERMIQNRMTIDHEYYEYDKLITPKLKLMQTNYKIITFLLEEKSEGKNRSPHQISSNSLTFRSIIVELGFPHLISCCLNPHQLSEVCYQKNYASLKIYQQLLAKIVQLFRDYPPLVCLMAGETELFYLNKIHLKRCCEEIESERQDNEDQFAHLALLGSVNLKLERYLANHKLQNLVMFSHSQSIPEKYSSLDIAISTENQYSQKMQGKSELGRMFQTNNPIILNESQILRMLDQSTRTGLNIGLSVATDNRLFQFSQQIQLLNTKLLILLKSHYSQMTKIRNYNLQIKYDCSVISNDRFNPNSRPYNSKKRMIKEWKFNQFKQILSKYLSSLLAISLQYRIANFTQFLAALLEEFSDAYSFQKYLKKQEIFDQSDIIEIQSERKFVQRQFFEANKDQKTYTGKLSQMLDRLYENLVIINTSLFEIEEQMQNQVFIHQFIKLKGYLTNKSTIKPNKSIMNQHIISKKPNSLSTLTSAHKSRLSMDKTNQKINPEQPFLDSATHNQSPSSSIADYLLNISYNRNRYAITPSGKQIQTESLQNVLELSFQYHCSIFSQPLDILQQILAAMHLIKQNENGIIERYGLHAILHLFQFNDI